MFSRHRLHRLVRLVLTWFVFGVAVNVVAPAWAADASMDPSICSAASTTDSTPNSGSAGHSHLDCTLCAPVLNGAPPSTFGLPLLPTGRDAPIAWCDAASPSVARRTSHARGPPHSLN